MSRKITSMSDLPVLSPQRAPHLFHQRHQLQPGRHGRAGAPTSSTSTTSIADGRQTYSSPPSSPTRSSGASGTSTTTCSSTKEVLDYIKGPRRRSGGGLPDVRRKTGHCARSSASKSGFRRPRCITRCDNKMETVRIGNKAGVPSVPNVLARVDSYRAPARS